MKGLGRAAVDHDIDVAGAFNELEAGDDVVPATKFVAVPAGVVVDGLRCIPADESVIAAAKIDPTRDRSHVGKFVISETQQDGAINHSSV